MQFYPISQILDALRTAKGSISRLVSVKKALHVATLIALMFTTLQTTSPQPALAQSTTVVDAYDQGWYDSNGFHIPTNVNYAVGLYDNLEVRNFFTFNLGGVTDTVASASLRVWNPINGYESPDSSEHWMLYDVSTPVTSLVNGTGAAFGDLGNGVSYGSKTVSASDQGQFVTVNLNCDAVAAINHARGGFYSIGGKLTSLAGHSTNQLFAFWSHTGFVAPKLDLTLGSPANNCAEPVEVRKRMNESLGSFTYDPDNTSNGATLGTLLINFDFEYLSGLPLESLYVEVTTANNAFLQNADGGPGGVGAIMSIANADLPNDISPSANLFDETETLGVPFSVGIEGPPWGLNFALYGYENNGVQASSSEPLATFAIDSNMVALGSGTGIGAKMQPSIFLPVVQ